MKRQPDLYTPSEIKEWDVLSKSATSDWKPARPMGHNLRPLSWRWKMAWGVLTGRYDVLDWRED